MHLRTALLVWLTLAALYLPTTTTAADPNQQPTPEWIWATPEAKDNETAFFRKSFEARPGVLKAILLGASYTANSDLFATGWPLNVIDVTFGPDAPRSFPDRAGKTRNAT